LTFDGQKQQLDVKKNLKTAALKAPETLFVTQIGIYVSQDLINPISLTVVHKHKTTWGKTREQKRSYWTETAFCS
jgi:hypothetical protein